jgi:hypothetical protein
MMILSSFLLFMVECLTTYVSKETTVVQIDTTDYLLCSMSISCKVEYVVRSCISKKLCKGHERRRKTRKHLEVTIEHILEEAKIYALQS